MIPHKSIANTIILSGWIDVSKEDGAFTREFIYPMENRWKLCFKIHGMLVKSEMTLHEWGIVQDGKVESFDCEIEIQLYKGKIPIDMTWEEEDNIAIQISNMIHYE